MKVNVVKIVRFWIHPTLVILIFMLTAMAGRLKCLAIVGAKGVYTSSISLSIHVYIITNITIYRICTEALCSQYGNLEYCGRDP